MLKEKCTFREEVIDGVVHTVKKYDLNKDTFVCNICRTSKHQSPDLEMFMDANFCFTCKPCMDSQLHELERLRLEKSPVEKELIGRGLNDGGKFGLLPLDKDEQVVTFDDPLVCSYALLFGGAQLSEYQDIELALSALHTAANRYKNDLRFAQHMDDEYINIPRSLWEANFK